MLLRGHGKLNREAGNRGFTTRAQAVASLTQHDDTFYHVGPGKGTWLRDVLREGRSVPEPREKVVLVRHAKGFGPTVPPAKPKTLRTLAASFFLYTHFINKERIINCHYSSIGWLVILPY